MEQVSYYVAFDYTAHARADTLYALDMTVALRPGDPTGQLPGLYPKAPSDCRQTE